MAKPVEIKSETKSSSYFTPSVIGVLADEVSKTILERLPYMLRRTRKKQTTVPVKKIEKAVFLDTSAIIDGRIFSIIKLGLLQDTFVVLHDVLLELKHIADSQDSVRRERGRKGLEMLEAIKREKGVKVVVFSEENEKIKEVDEKLIYFAKRYKGRLLTCDYNLEKKANIQGVFAVNINGLANCLKVTAVPGESLHIKVLHQGKEQNQGVGYLDDGTMIVIEQGKEDIGKEADVVVSRVIQTTAGRILFAKKI